MACSYWHPQTNSLIVGNTIMFHTSPAQVCFIWYLKEFEPWHILFSTTNLIMVWMKCSVSLTMGSFQVTCISQNMFCNLAKITHLGDLETDHFNLELAIELYSLHFKCLLRDMSLKIASYDTLRIITEFPRIFNINLRWIWPICYLSIHWLHCIHTWMDKL